ncbi:MAG: GNAT family N-acetyltransferase [Micromonosporaceae bacterium]|nr:GNAT family N-acetyltransferase [Micromonosporaceae bacterium]
MTAVTVRPATPADYPAIALLTVSAYRADWQVTPGHPYERPLADVAGRAGAGELLVAVASERSSEASDAAGFTDPTTGKVVGSVLFVLPGSRYAELAGPGEAEFRMLAVDPAAQGRGVGEALARACLDRAGRLGCRAVRICTRDFARTAHRLYERLGFVRTPERDWTPRRGVDLYALRLDLPATPDAEPSNPT